MALYATSEFVVWVCCKKFCSANCFLGSELVCPGLFFLQTRLQCLHEVSVFLPLLVASFDVGRVLVDHSSSLLSILSVSGGRLSVS